MNSSENLPVVVEQAGTDWGTALIGVVGVLVGAIISAGFAWRKARNDQAQVVRENVTKFRHATDLYLGLVTAIAQLSTEGRLHDQPGEWGAERGKEISQRYRAAKDAGYAIVACPDGRVAQKADEITKLIVKFANGHDRLFSGEPKEWISRKPIDRELLVLLHMVRAKPCEKFKRFRSADRAEKAVPDDI